MSLPQTSLGYSESSAPSVNDFDHSYERSATVTEKFHNVANRGKSQAVSSTTRSPIFTSGGRVVEVTSLY
jgi:hypothetical protein